MRVFDQPPRGGSPLLFFAGLGLLGSVFLLANPGGNAPLLGWPWEVFRPDGPPLRWGLAALWTLTGLAALGLSLFASFSARASILVVLGAGLLAAVSLAPGSDFALLAHPGQLVAVALLAGGLFLSGHPEGAGTARGAAACGAILLLLHVALFASTEAMSPLAGLDRVRADVLALGDEGASIDQALRTGTEGVIAVSALALLLGALLGVLTVFGVRARWLGWLGCGMVVLGVLWPALSTPFVDGDVRAATLEAAGRDALVQDGGALFLLAAGLVVDLLPRRRSA